MRLPSRSASLLLLLGMTIAAADERRAPPPDFTPQQTRGIFFDSLEDAFRGPRPTIASVRKTAVAAAAKATAADIPAAAQGPWSAMISAGSIEDEIKRVRLHFDSVVTTPGAFNSGGYQDARLDLTVLATLFAIINEYQGEVRWKDQAAAARDLIARTAFNCKAGSSQVFNEAKLRKADLQDLVSGSGLANRNAEAENDWSMIADRSPLMEYAESLIESLEDSSNDEATIKKEVDLVRRNAELLAALGEVLASEGMDEADDEDYAKLSRDMSVAGKALTDAIERADWAAAMKGVGAIRQRCDACHENYR